MAIAFDSRNEDKFGSGVTNVTWQHTCAAGASLFVGMAVQPFTADGVTVTFNGTPLTLILSQVGDSSDTDKYQRLYWLQNPDTGSAHDVVVSNGGVNTMNIDTGSVSYTGVVSLGTPVGAIEPGATPTTSISYNVTSATGELVLDCTTSSGNSADLTVTGAGHFRRVDTWENWATAISETPGAATVTVTYTSDNGLWRGVAVSLSPSGGGGGGGGLMWL